MKVGEHFMNLNSQHAKNKWQFATMHARGSMINHVNVSLHIENKSKFLQFVIISTFYNNDAFIDYENMQQ